MSNRIALAALAIVLLSAACVQDGGAWQKPGTGDESKTSDMQGCRAYARERLNSRAVRHTEAYHSRAVAADDLARNDDLAALRLMLSADQKRLERRFYDECMRASGYSRTE